MTSRRDGESDPLAKTAVATDVGAAPSSPSDALARTAGHVNAATPTVSPSDPLAKTAAAIATDATQSDTVAPSAALDATLDSSSGPPPGRRARADYPDLVAVNPDHYDLGKEIARGGMGRIRLARDLRLGRKVAVKEILVKVGDLARRFVREARITSRLQHPSIVNVHEAGVWPSGEPFYAMKLVTGRSLDEVVTEAKTLDQRLALLPNVLAIADAMAYAHGDRVIHRDLKPKNVLVGAFGETVVIDWGLAKDLTDRSSAPDFNHGPFRTSGHDAETEVGDVMGTPQFMPPEQAEGQLVDERADVYALGAILDYVLSGKPAYTGTTGVEILEAVKRGPPTPLIDRQPGVPPDLVAIVERAMARDPAARYPTAREVAEDLRRYQTGQLVGAHRYSLRQLLGRWIRRHRAAVSVAAVAVLVLLVLGAVAIQRIVRAQRVAEEQREVAEEQRRFAVDSRGDAEDLLGFMLVNLRDKLTPLGRLDLLDDVAKKAVTYYDRRGENLSDAELGKRAIARRNLGDVLSAQGNTAEALREYRASRAVATTRAKEDPADTARQRDLSDSHQKVGDVLFAQGDLVGALAAYRSARAIREAIIAKEPSAAKDVSVAVTKIGEVLFSQGDLAGALAEYRGALAHLQKLAAQDPTNAGLKHRMQINHERIGEALFAQGDPAGALAEYRRSLTISEALTARDPTNANYQRNLAVGHETVGDILLVQGDVSGALAKYRAALLVLEALAAKDPTNADRQRYLSVEHLKVGDALRAQGDAAGALAEYRVSLTLFEKLATSDPTSADRQRDLAAGHLKVGSVLFAQGSTAAALAEYRSAQTAFEKLVTKDTTSADRQADLAFAQQQVGDVLVAQRNLPSALDVFRASLGIRETLAAKDPSNADRQVDLAVSQSKIGDVLLAQGNAGGALEKFRLSQEIFETLATKDATNAERQVGVADNHAKLGDTLAAQRDRAGAITHYNQSLEIVKRLLEKDPKNANWAKKRDALAKKIEALRAR